MTLLQRTSVFIFFTLLILLSNNAFAQATKESQFPIGGWQFYGLSDDEGDIVKQLQQDANINTFFFGNGNMTGDQLTLLKGFSNGTTQTAYPGIDVTKYCGTRFAGDGIPASDVRFFLASGKIFKSADLNPMTFDPQTPNSVKFDATYAYDMVNNWANKRGGQFNTSTPEWHIAPADGVVSSTTDVLLSDLQSWNDAIDRHAQIGICDFIYRIDETSNTPDYTSGDMPDNTEIYDVVYTLTRGQHDANYQVINVQTPVAGDIITYKITRNDVIGLNTGSYNAHLTDPLWIGTTPDAWGINHAEHPNIKKYNGNDYALAHTEFNMHPTVGATVWDVVKVDCTLKKISTANSKGIYVRGLRLRTDLADKLLRGYLDHGDYSYTSAITGVNYTFPAVSFTFDDLWASFLSNFSLPSQEALAFQVWKKIPYVTCGGETTFPAWRSLAYLDRQWVKFSQISPHNRVGGQHILTFLSENTGTYNYPWYRSIYEDETGQVPPPLVPQCYQVYAPGIDRDINPGYPRDILDNAHMNSSDGFGTWGYHTLGYADYTNFLQYRFDMCDPIHELQATLQLPSGRKPGKWIGSIWDISSYIYDYWGEPTDQSLSRFRKMPSDLLTESDGTVKVLDFVISDIKNFCRPELGHVFKFNDFVNVDGTGNRDNTTGNQPGTALNGYGSSDDAHPAAHLQYRKESRTQIPTELRENVWSAIAYGAKGILFNTLGSDRGENVGLLDVGFAHPNNWWDDNVPSGQNKNILFSNIPFGECPHPLIGEYDPSISGSASDQKVWEQYAINCATADPPHNLVACGWVTPEDITAFQTANFPSDQKIFPNNTDDYTLIQKTIQSYADANGFTHANDHSNYTWQPEMKDECGTPKWAGFMISTGTCYDNNCGVYSPKWDQVFRSSYWNTFSPLLWCPSYYGFANNWEGLKIIGNDLSHCANTLKDLSWINTYSLPQVSLSTGSTSGSITVIKVISGGSGYSSPTASLSAGNATLGTPTIDGNGAITSIPITSAGSGNTSPPQVIISGGGTGASAVAIVGDGGALSTDFVTNSPFLSDDIVSYKLARFQDLIASGLKGDLRTSDESTLTVGDPEPDAVFGTTSNRIDRSSDLTDDRRLYEIGIFSLTNPRTWYQKVSKYVVLANKRTWPYTIVGSSPARSVASDDGSGSNTMLGAIDARKFSAKIDADLSNVNSPNWKWHGLKPTFTSSGTLANSFAITDYRYPCAPIETRAGEPFYLLPFDPGEGTLLRIEPLISTGILGMNSAQPCVSYLLTSFPINNSRHISALENSTGMSASYQMTYIERGGVAVSYPVEGVASGDSSMSLRYLDTPADSLIDTNIHCLHPAISAHGLNPKQIALCYAIDSMGSGAHLDTTWVVFRKAGATTPYAFSSYTVLDRFKTMSNTTTATPAITPAKTGCGKWWVSWRNPATGGHIALLDTNGSVISQKTFSAGSVSSTRQISITSHLWHDPTVAQTDTCYMAFEEGDHPSSQIYYLQAYCNGSGGVDTMGLKLLSGGLPYCEHHNPNIAIAPNVGAMVTWEAIASHFTYGDSAFMLHRTHYAMLHGRYVNGSGWGGYQNLYGFDVVVPNPSADTLSMLPVVSVANVDTARMHDTVWNDVLREVWHDPFDEQVHIAHMGWLNGTFIPKFETVMMPDASLWPTSPVRTMHNGVMQPLMYTHPTYADDTTYTPECTIYDFPISTLIKVAPLTQYMTAQPKAATCGQIVQTRLTHIAVKLDTSINLLAWLARDSAMFDSIYMPQPTWSDTNSIQSQKFNLYAGDTLELGRDFRVGSYDAGDTTEVKNYLVGGSDYVMMKVSLRSASTKAIIKTIDSCILFSGGFHRTGSLADSGISKTVFTSTISGQVYLTLDAYRGNSSNTFELRNTEVYGEPDQVNFIPGPPDSDTSFKKSQPPVAQSKPNVSNITMSVHPNPFRTQTTIDVEVPEDVVLNVTVFDLLGKPVSNLFNNYSAGTNYSFTLTSKELNAGMYFVRVQSGNQVVTRKIQLLK